MGAGQSRQHGEEEVDDRGCCHCLRKTMLSFIIAICLLASAGLAAASLITGKDQYWTVFASKDMEPAYKIQTGYLWFTVGDDTAKRQSLNDMANTLWILGLTATAALAASALLAITILVVLGFGNGGRGLTCLGIIAGVVTVGVMGAYYGVAAVAVRNYTYKTLNTAYTVWPNWSWCLGMGSSVLWLLIGIFARGYPKKRVYRKQVSPRASPMISQQHPGLTPRGASGGDVENQGNNQVAPLETEVAGERPRGAKRGLFGRAAKPTQPLSARAQQAYREQTDDIRERYTRQAPE